MENILNEIKHQYDLNFNNVFNEIEDVIKIVQKRNNNINFINNNLKENETTIIINFNIGGTLVDINSNILINSSIPFNLFSILFKERWKKYLLKDKNNRIFLNFDIKWVQPIFDYFRMKSLNENSLLNIKEKNNNGFQKVVKIFHLEELLLNHIVPIYSSISNTDNIIKVSNNFNNEFVKNILLIHVAKTLNISSNIKLNTNKIYSGCDDGFSSINFHKCCDNISNTICYIKDHDDNIFGCFNPIGYSSSNYIVPTNKSFLFSMQKENGKPIIYPLCEGKYGVNIQSKDILFANGEDLLISNNCNSNFNSCKKIIDKNMFINSSSIINFQVKEIEIYKVIKEGLWYNVYSTLNNIINNEQQIDNISNMKISKSFSNIKSCIIDKLFQNRIFSDWLINQLLLHNIEVNNPDYNSIGLLAELVYSGKKDGFTSINFHKCCDHITNTVYLLFYRFFYLT